MFVPRAIVLANLFLALWFGLVQIHHVNRFWERSVECIAVAGATTLTPILIQSSRPAIVRVHTVVMIPSPMSWHKRRHQVNEQFLRGGWGSQSVAMLYVLGTKGGKQLEKELEIDQTMREEISLYRGKVEYFFSDCRDMGDERNNPNGTSATTCKVYMGLKRVYALYTAEYVWRGADDAYLNLHMWFRIVPLLPKGNIYFGSMRRAGGFDLNLRRQPDLQNQTFHSLTQFGPYMVGMGFMLSWSVVEFLAESKIPPKLMWCEDVMVGMWLLPYQIEWIDSNQMGFSMQNRADRIRTIAHGERDVLLLHYMKDKDWVNIDENGTIGLFGR